MNSSIKKPKATFNSSKQSKMMIKSSAVKLQPLNS